MTKRDFAPIHPGEIVLEDFLKPMQISQYYLAQAIGVPPRRINEIVHGKRESRRIQRWAWAASLGWRRNSG